MSIVNGLSVGTTTLTAVAPGYTDGTLDISVTNNVLSVPASLTVALGGDNVASRDHLERRAGWWAGGVADQQQSCRRGTVVGHYHDPGGRGGGERDDLGEERPGTATVVASSPNFASASAQATTQGNLNITVSSIQIRPAFPGTITIELQSAGNPVAAPAPGVSIAFAAGAPGVRSIATVTIPTGLTSTTSSVTYGGSASLPCTTTVVASSAGLAGDSISVTVNPTRRSRYCRHRRWSGRPDGRRLSPRG